MYKKTKNTYLSELFLESLNGDFSRKAVLKALEKCNDEILKRMHIYPCAKGVIDTFFCRVKQKKRISNQIRQELIDFWDVYSEFDNMFQSSTKKEYLILQMI